MATMTIDEALAHARIHAVPGGAQAVLAAEVERLTAALDLIQRANPDCHFAKVTKGLTGGISLKWHDGSPFDASNWVGAKLHLCYHPLSFLGCWVPVEAFPPELSEDVLVTILTDGTDTGWRAGFWDGEYWYILDTEMDEPVQVNAGCNFVVTHWIRVNPAEQGMTDE